MLKPLCFVMNLFILLMILPSKAYGQYSFIADDDSLETQICIAAASNDLLAVKNAISKISTKAKSMKGKIRQVILKITCNDMDLVKFSAIYHAVDTFGYFNKKAPRKMRLPVNEISIKQLNANRDSELQTILVAAK